MALGRIFDIAAAIVGVATVFVLVSSPNTAAIVKAATDGFAGSLRASMGK